MTDPERVARPAEPRFTRDRNSCLLGPTKNIEERIAWAEDGRRERRDPAFLPPSTVRRLELEAPEGYLHVHDAARRTLSAWDPSGSTDAGRHRRPTLQKYQRFDPWGFPQRGFHGAVAGPRGCQVFAPYTPCGGGRSGEDLSKRGLAGTLEGGAACASHR